MLFYSNLGGKYLCININENNVTMQKIIPYRKTSK